MIKFKEFDVGDADYKEQMEQFQTEYQNAEFVQITGGHMGYEKIWFKYDDTINQPQLMIPKSIADMLYKELNPLERESMLETFMLGINYLVLSDELMKFVLTGNNYHVLSAYLAGKALGVDLVKVVADD